jgi:bifunctional isochorismate lyase / aryl carrier protein
LKARSSDGKAAEYIRLAKPYMSRHRTANHKLTPKRSALLVIDMQELFLDKSSHSYLPDVEDIIGNVRDLIDAYRKHSLPVIFTRHATKKSESAGAMGRWWGNVVRDGDKAGEIDPRFAPSNGEKVIRKTRYSAFVGTDLLQHLYAESVSSLVITGVMTHLCCESTARDAFMRDFDVFLVVDGTASKTEDLHVSSIKTLTDGFAIPVTTSEVVRWLKTK